MLVASTEKKGVLTLCSPWRAAFYFVFLNYASVAVSTATGVSPSAAATGGGRRSWGGGGTLALFLEARLAASTERAACSFLAFMRRMKRSTWPAVSTMRCSPV